MVKIADVCKMMSLLSNELRDLAEGLLGLHPGVVVEAEMNCKYWIQIRSVLNSVNDSSSCSREPA